MWTGSCILPGMLMLGSGEDSMPEGEVYVILCLRDSWLALIIEQVKCIVLDKMLLSLYKSQAMLLAFWQ